jgi:hypothetical protein
MSSSSCAPAVGAVVKSCKIGPHEATPVKDASRCFQPRRPQIRVQPQYGIVCSH